MRVIRDLIRDGFCGGPLAALIGVLMALQALIGGFGTGAMAYASTDEAIICSADDSGQHSQHALDQHSAHGAGHGSGDAPDLPHTRDCCLTACQVASAVHVGIPSKAPAPAVFVAIRSVTAVVTTEASTPPRQLGLSGDARGPPVLPV
jgi:hypothetical protein